MIETLQCADGVAKNAAQLSWVVFGALTEGEDIEERLPCRRQRVIAKGGSNEPSSSMVKKNDAAISMNNQTRTVECLAVKLILMGVVTIVN